jgi:transcriptional regulator with XRE-family HTH domain
MVRSPISRGARKCGTDNEIGYCFRLVTSTMRAVLTERLTAPGGATSRPVAVAAETPTLVLVPPGSSGDQSAIRRQAFARRLIAARERSGVTLDEIAKTTKVSPSLLAALERGDASRWPKGIFRRAFFRDYVAAIGLSPDPLVAEFLQTFPDGEVHPVATQALAPEAAGDLRMTLESVPGWRVTRARVARELIVLAPVLALATGVTLWSDASPWTAAGIIGLCYYQRLTGIVRTLTVRRAARSNGR